MLNQLVATSLPIPQTLISFPSQQGDQTESGCPLQYELPILCTSYKPKICSSWSLKMFAAKRYHINRGYILHQALFHIIALIAMSIMDYWGWRNNAALYTNPMTKWCSCILLQLNNSRWRRHLRSNDSTLLSYSGFLYAETSTASKKAHERPTATGRRVESEICIFRFFSSWS